MNRLSPSILIAFLLLIVTTRTRAEEIFFSDQRMVEASSLLSDRDQYPRAISLYRQVLDEFPSHVMARLWLARLLSWSGENDQSLAEYDRLLEFDPPPQDVDVERAEVLSWAGRYDEALSAFDRILLERPDQRRAIVGKARVYSWSGRRGEAAKAYKSALALGDDVEIRKELSQLRQELGAGSDTSGRYYFDSDGFRHTTVQSTASVDLGFDTRFIGEMAFSRVGRDDSVLLQAIGTPLTSNGLSGLVGLEQRITPEVVVSGQLGYSWWESAPGQFLARAKVEASFPTETSLGFQLDYGGFLRWSSSFEALNAGIDATNLRATVWQGLSQQWGAFGYFETTFVGDGNQRIALGASTDYRPFESFGLQIGLAADYVAYTGQSILYYAPTTDIGVVALARIDQPVVDWATFFIDTTLGMGFAEEAGIKGSGLSYAISGGARVKRGGLELTIHAGRSQSQRSIVYTSYTFGATLNAVF